MPRAGRLRLCPGRGNSSSLRRWSSVLCRCRGIDRELVILPRVTLFRREVSFRGLLPVLAVEKTVWGQHGALDAIEAAGVDGDPVWADAWYTVRMDAAEFTKNVLRHACVVPIGRQRICS